MKKTYENQRGITLIALIVSVMVMLILVGVPIIMLSGDKNIIDFSLKAKKDTSLLSIEEYVNYATLAAQADGKGIVKQSPLERELGIYLGKRGIEYTLAGDSSKGWTVTVPSEQAIFQIDSDGNIEIEDIIDNSKSLVLGLVDDLGTRSTIYLYNNTENITSGTITITNPDSTTQNITAIEDTSEISDTANYATYTVSKNGIYTFTVTANGETTETKIRVKNIEKFTKIDDMNLNYVNGDNKAYRYKGAAVPKGYYVDTKSKVETGLVITDSINEEGYSTGNEWVWVPVNSTIGNNDYYGEETQATALAGATSVTYTKYSKLYSFIDKTMEIYGTFHPYGTNTGTLSRPSTTSDAGYREIAILRDTSRGEVVKYDSVNNRTTESSFSNVTDLANQYVTDYDNMVESTNTYKGFYIGRYEITSNGEKAGIPLTDVDWYTFYNQCLTYGTDYTESGMIYGCLWDATMQWLAKSNYSVGYTGNPYSGYGNFKEESIKIKNNTTTLILKAQGTSLELATGQTSYTKSNNVYDLSGNHQDWTQETSGWSSRVYRSRYI